MFSQNFSRGLWMEPKKPHFSRTNQTAIKQRRQKKRVKIFLNFTYLYKTQPGQTVLEISRFFSKKSTRQMFGYPSYGPSKTDEALNLKQQKFWANFHGNNNSDCCKNDPRTPNIHVSNCSCYCASTTVSLVQDSMPIRFLCRVD